MADDTNTNTGEMQEITDKEAEWEGAAALLGACWLDVAHNERCEVRLIREGGRPQQLWFTSPPRESNGRAGSKP
jgi:hypothetical protein